MQNRNGKRFAIGVDYGTNSVRAIIVDVDNGAELASHVFNYPSGEAGILLDPKDPNLARQNPADYIEGFLSRSAARCERRRAGADSSPRTSSESAWTPRARRPFR